MPMSVSREVKNRAWTKWYRANKSKHHASVRKNERKRRAEGRKWLNDLKVSRGCKRCQYRQHPAALDFHHRDGEKKEFSLAEAFNGGYGMARILAEIEKCDVLCANCHRIDTYEHAVLKLCEAGRIV